ARAEEVAVLREALKDPALPDQALQNQAERVRALWPRLDGAPPAERLRLAALLAGFLPPDKRWQQHAQPLVEHLVGLNPLEVAAWVPALVPLYGPLTPELVKK